MSRELRRNGTGAEYLAGQAQRKAEARRRDRPLERKMDKPEINEFVRGGLAQEWSPEQIAGRLKQQHPETPEQQVSAQTMLVDRQSRYTIVVQVQSKQADHVQAKIKHRMKDLDAERRHSITFDNGTEFARCHRLEKHLGLRRSFADPGCPYQRGTNENTKGLIRQYFPKGTDFRDISHQEVRRVEELLNNRPRACLGFRTPAEHFFEKNPPAGCD